MNPQRSYLAIAHRGASAYEPENTLRAFRRAIELGADMSELDVHLSKDGQIVVIHNSVVETPGGRRAVAEMTLAELKALDMGKGERIPTLQEAIDAVRGRGGLYIELKGDGTPHPVADLLRANGFTERHQVIAGSFRLPLVRELHDDAPDIAASILVGPVLPAAELISAAHSVGASYVHLCWRDKADQPHRLVTRDLLDSLHAAGLGVVLWNEERLSEIAALSTLDVQAICGNAPDLL